MNVLGHPGGLVARVRAVATAGLLLLPRLLAGQATPDTLAVSLHGTGARTVVLVPGIVGGAAGFRRLERLLVAQGNRVLIIDPFRLSIDSADVSFAALARRVGRVLEAHHVVGAVVVAHAHGAGAMLRAAADPMATRWISAMYFLDAGAIPTTHTKVLTGAFRFIPIIARIPGGKRLLRSRIVAGLRANSANQSWIDEATQHQYADGLLDDVDRAVALGARLLRATEPESVTTVISRVRVPLTVLLGAAPHESAPQPEEVAMLGATHGLFRIDTLAGVGHFIQEEVPDEVMRHIVTTVAPARGKAQRAPAPQPLSSRKRQAPGVSP